ncbi:hypothetical protein F2P79_010519 [Pimephales promelas]|nr:hypothetical protein F2P79_010519 [Pimephales promelas]
MKPSAVRLNIALLIERKWKAGFHLSLKVSVQCEDNPYGYGGVMVIGDETFPMTSSCTIPDMTGYNQYIGIRCGNQAGVINENDAQASCNDSRPTRCSQGPSFGEGTRKIPCANFKVHGNMREMMIVSLIRRRRYREKKL